MKNVLLLGDSIRDLNLMEYPQLASGHYQALPKTAEIETPGGVMFLHNILTQTLSDLAEVTCGPGIKMAQRVTVFNVWRQFSKTTKSKDRVWRIDRIIGRTEASGEGAARLENSKDTLPRADLLVIDSLGLEWLEMNLEDPRLFALAVLESIKPREIVLKISTLEAGIPFLTCPDLLDRLTVVISAKALRERGAAISEGLSWDRTIEDTVREFHSGLSSLDLACCRRVIVLFASEGAAIFTREPGKQDIRLEKFLFHPSQFEGHCKSKHQGKMFGDLSLATAAMVRHLLEKDRYPAFVALSLALSAMRLQQENGLAEQCKEKNPKKRFDFAAHVTSLCDLLNIPVFLDKHPEGSGNTEMTTEKIRETQTELEGHLRTFTCAFRHDQLDDPCMAGQSEQESNLLRDATGCGIEFVAAKAFQIVTQGGEKAMGKVPVASFGHFVTADREEIERINAVRKLIVAYIDNPKDKNPLSIAVFGPPGSGKSFSIKQLAGELNFSDKSIRTFNLSEFQEIGQLHIAFHIVRDATVKGEIPLIFWDEFDSGNLKWLKEFLAPMQDAEFRAGSVVHPLGRAIFVFAGGVFSSFKEFEDKAWSGEKIGNSDAKELKVPDFISRLRGYINIKGPNPSRTGEKNHEYLIRRAILFRSVLERACPELVKTNRSGALSAPVVQAFLRIDKYKHGARSLESLVKMSNLTGSCYFGEAALPPDDLLDLHVDAGKFREIMRQGTMDEQLVELIAEACHRSWCSQKKAEGYELGKERSDVPPKTHPLLKDYAKLREEEKEGNRITARLTKAKLAQEGLQIKRLGIRSKKAGEDLLAARMEKLIRIEHDIWMRGHLLAGYEHATKTNDRLKLHKCIAHFKYLTAEDKRLDEAIVASLGEVLHENGYAVAKSEPKVKAATKG